MKDGIADGQKEIDAKRASLGGKTDMLFGSREFLKNDYVARATGTQVGIGANSREEAMYPIYDKDADGQQLDGSIARYTLRFAKDDLPPVNAFWSLTMYGLPQQLLVKNSIHRYLINSPMLPLPQTRSRWRSDHLHSSGPSGQRQRSQLAASPEGTVHDRHPLLLA